MSDSFSQIDAFVLLGGTWQVVQHNRCHECWIWLSCHEWLWMSSFVGSLKVFPPDFNPSKVFCCSNLWCLGTRNKTQSNSESGFSAFQMFHDTMFHAASGCFQLRPKAIVIGMLYILPLSILHVWDYYKLSLDVQGRTKNLNSRLAMTCKARVNKHEKKHAGWRAFHC